LSLNSLKIKLCARTSRDVLTLSKARNGFRGSCALTSPSPQSRVETGDVPEMRGTKLNSPSPQSRVDARKATSLLRAA